MKKMNHETYPKSLRSKSDAAIRFTIKDAQDAVAAMPNGENVSYYLDEVCYCADELYRRRGFSPEMIKAHNITL